MRMSKLYLHTLREVPAEAELPSHQLLLRAGMIKQLASGVYNYLPTGYKVIKKIENIVREEMDNIDSQEVLMPAIQPAELWKESGRWDVFGPEMFKIKDRHNREFCLGPTHEEVITNMIKDNVKSYKQLPLSLYQIQTKYRDERRPRFGLMRGREFIMKDAYTFDLNEEGMAKSYYEMWKGYEKIFDRCNMKYKVVEGDSGAMGGNASHEFMATSEFGESAMVYCDDCNYAATDEKATFKYSVKANDEELLDMEEIHTPNAKTIEELSNLLDVSSDKLIKTLLYMANDEVVAVVIPGDRELNEVKLLNTLGVAEHEMAMADEGTVERVTNSDVGFAGPIGLIECVKILIDASVTEMKNLIVGANKTDYHIKNVNYDRDFKGQVVEDLLLVEEGDKCAKCGSTLKMDRGIEIGNIFQLGTKYADALGANYLDENGKASQIFMGSHGIGVSRTMAAIVEQNHDEDGIKWPLSVAPYQVVVTIVQVKNEEQVELGEKLYSDLKAMGIDVLLDDRKERAGVKFKDADLLGTPIRITVGKKADENIVEYSLRSDREKEEVQVSELEDKIKEEFKNQGLTI